MTEPEVACLPSPRTYLLLKWHDYIGDSTLTDATHGSHSAQHSLD